MTRIGFAYNQQPRPLASAHDGATADRPTPDTSDLRHAPSAQLALAPDADDEYAEWDTPATIDAVEAALRPLGRVIRLEAVGDFAERLRKARVDIVFNIAEGLHGPNRESHIPAICEFLGVPYTASDPFTLALCLDKARAKEALSARGVRTAPWALIQQEADLEIAREALAYPLFAKPVHEGSSKGITERSLCRNPAELDETARFLLERYQQPVIVERYLPGDEFTAAVLGNGTEARVLPIIRLNFASLPEGALPIYGYEAKWVWDGGGTTLDIHECPARVAPALIAELERLTLAAYRATGCRDWARIDLRLDDAGVPHVVEVNPLPGILPDPADNSCLPMAARTAGIAWDELMRMVLRLGATRCGVALSRARA